MSKKCFKTTLNTAIQAGSYSLGQLFFEEKELSHIRRFDYVMRAPI